MARPPAGPADRVSTPAAPLPPRGLLASQLETFRSQGYCVIPGALPPAELAAMRDAFDSDRRR